MALLTRGMRVIRLIFILFPTARIPVGAMCAAPALLLASPGVLISAGTLAPPRF